MGKIINLKASEYNELLEQAKRCEQDADGILIAIKLKDGSVMTGYYKMDFGTKQEIVGHIQADIIDQMILANTGERY